MTDDAKSREDELKEYILQAEKVKKEFQEMRELLQREEEFSNHVKESLDIYKQVDPRDIDLATLKELSRYRDDLFEEGTAILDKIDELQSIIDRDMDLLDGLKTDLCAITTRVNSRTLTD